MVQRVLVVDLSPELQVKRIIERDEISPEQAKAIIASQVDRNARLSVADDVLDNSGDITSLLSHVDSLHKVYLQLAQSGTQS